MKVKQDNLSQPLVTEDRVLIVDDSPENLRVLGSILSERYRVNVANSGRRALEILNEYKDFDVIILDIVMPEMDGVELCKSIKVKDEFREVPVIFISGLSDIDDKKSAFEVGGVDYIVKPFEKEEVIMRVETHLRIRRLQKELISKNRELEANYKRLKELEQLKDNLTNMIVHDLRSPLTGIISMFEILKMECESSENRNMMEYIKSGYLAANSLLDMINSLLDIARLEEGKLPLNVGIHNASQIVYSAISFVSMNTKNTKGNEVVPDIKADVRVICDADLIRRVLINLITNSIKHSNSKSPIKVVVQSLNSFAMFSVIDDGIGIPKEYHDKIFEKFGQVEIRGKNKKYSTGLGLTFCKLVVEAHNGTIGVESEVGKGSKFYFTIPSSS
ncbi:MAG: hybrid sensor histidine kinase/response regulator [Deltaproteobacteria bacterium]|nr:hybrid sensor histidine kinase/response regulator [Deltaproteobacteria bacterium]